MAAKDSLVGLSEGGAQPNISREKIIDFRFPLPPLAEQERIVARIKELEPLLAEYDKLERERESIGM